MRDTRQQRPRLVQDVEALAEQAWSRGAVRRANDLRAVAEHLRAKEARQVVIGVRPEALPRRRCGVPGRPHRALGRLRRVLGLLSGR
jgi:hypothetical protein